MFTNVLSIVAAIAVIIFAVIYLKKPLENREIEGAKSLIIRIILGCLLGIVVAFLVRI